MKEFAVLFAVAFCFLMRGRLLVWTVRGSAALYRSWLQLSTEDKFHVCFGLLFILAELVFIWFVWSR